MIEMVREYVVKEQYRGQFELAFGPGGAWSKLFSDSPGFRGTTLLREENRPGRYLTFDLWDTAVQREQWLSERKVEYTELKAIFAAWIELDKELGTFRLLAEGTVRPRGSARHRRR